jgi:hypothetical protein
LSLRARSAARTPTISSIASANRACICGLFREASGASARGLHEVRDADAVEPALAKERRILG